MQGWIKLHRTIKKHWVFENADYFKAWVSILLEVNHSDQKFSIKSKLFNCKRGESLNSLDTWARIFGRNWNKSKVRRFFKMLESDTMVVLKSEHLTTRLTVYNYETYQDQRNADETEMKRKRNADETEMTPNKNVKKDKNEKNDKYTKGNYNVLNKPFDIAFQNFKEMRIKSKKPMTPNAEELIKSKLRTMTKDPNVAIQILEQSTMCGYIGVFPLKSQDVIHPKVGYNSNKPNFIKTPDSELGTQADLDKLMNSPNVKNIAKKVE